MQSSNISSITEFRPPYQEPEGFSDLAAYAMVVRRRWLPACVVGVGVLAAAILLASRGQPQYVAEGQLLVKKRDDALSLLTTPGTYGQRTGELESLNALGTPLDTETEVLRSTPLLRAVIEHLNLKGKDGDPLDTAALSDKLEVEPIKGADIMVVSYKGDTPQQAAEVVSTLMQFYIARNLQTNRAEAAAARDFISQKLPKIAQDLQQAEASLRLFQERNQVVELQAEAESAVTSMSDLDKQITQASTALAGSTAQLNTLQQKLGLPEQQAIVLNALSESKSVQEALVQYEKVQQQLAVQRTIYTDASPTVLVLINQERSLRALLQERVSQVLGNSGGPAGRFQLDTLKAKILQELVTVEANRQSFTQQLQTLAQIRNVYQQRANVLPRLQQTQRQLERQVELTQANYKTLVERLQEVQIAENQNLGNVRILAPAVAPKEPTPSKKRLLLPVAGVIGGGLLGLITALLLDLLDSSVQTAKDVRDRFRYPLLGLVPVVGTPSALRRFGNSHSPWLPVRDDPSSLVSEAYRMIQAKLKFLSPDAALKSIAITSFVPREGKSTVAANLAIALSQLGHRVLLIDADLRYPMQHSIWELGPVSGLTDLIIGQVEMSKALYEVLPNLTVLPAGTLPPNPLSLLDSDRMHALLHQFEQRFDFVLLDTSPLTLVADTLPLGRATDGLLLVARPGVLDVASANAGKELLTQSAQSILGLVINGVQSSRESKNYFAQAETYHAPNRQTLLHSKTLTSSTNAKL